MAEVMPRKVSLALTHLPMLLPRQAAAEVVAALLVAAAVALAHPVVAPLRSSSKT